MIEHANPLAEGLSQDFRVDALGNGAARQHAAVLQHERMREAGQDLLHVMGHVEDDGRAGGAHQGRDAVEEGFARHGVEWWLQPHGPDSARPLDGAASALAYRLPEFGLTLPFRPRSLRARLTLWYTGVLAALLLVFGAAALVLLDRALRANIDTSLATLARNVVAVGMKKDFSDHEHPLDGLPKCTATPVEGSDTRLNVACTGTTEDGEKATLLGRTDGLLPKVATAQAGACIK